MSRITPRFLLPQLSWKTGSVGGQTLRAFATTSYGKVVRVKSSRKALYYPLRSDAGSNSLQSSRNLRYLQAHRSFHATARQLRDHHFDTLKFVQRLKGEGFSEAQAVAMMKVLSDVIEERCKNIFCLI